jgi:hypothetical protein
VTLRGETGLRDLVGTFEVKGKGQHGDVDRENLIRSASVQPLTEHRFSNVVGVLEHGRRLLGVEGIEPLVNQAREPTIDSVPQSEA